MNDILLRLWDVFGYLWSAYTFLIMPVLLALAFHEYDKDPRFAKRLINLSVPALLTLPIYGAAGLIVLVRYIGWG